MAAQKPIPELSSGKHRPLRQLMILQGSRFNGAGCSCMASGEMARCFLYGVSFSSRLAMWQQCSESRSPKASCGLISELQDGHFCQTKEVTGQPRLKRWRYECHPLREGASKSHDKGCVYRWGHHSNHTKHAPWKESRELE